MMGISLSYLFDRRDAWEFIGNSSGAEFQQTLHILLPLRMEGAALRLSPCIQLVSVERFPACFRIARVFQPSPN